MPSCPWPQRNWRVARARAVTAAQTVRRFCEHGIIIPWCRTPWPSDPTLGRKSAKQSNLLTVAGGVLELASMTTWPGIASEDALISPQEARLAWREFMSASGLSVQQVGLKVTRCHPRRGIPTADVYHC